LSTRARLERELGAQAVGRLEALGEVPVAFPRDEEMALELVRLASAEGWALALVGGGRALGWGAFSRTPDLAISTRELAGIVEFEPGDGTITARAGTSLAELRGVAREAGLELTPDVPRPAQTTLGGMIGAGRSGPDRLRHGPGRLHVLGTRTISPQGEVTKSGGRLVKNVTGYDLHRLYCASFGSLGLVVEASLRLFAAPEEVIVLSREYSDLAEALRVAEGLRGRRVTPAAITIANPGSQPSTWRLSVVLAGRASHLELEEQRIADLLPDAECTRGDAARALREHLRDLEPASHSAALLHLAAPPSMLRQACGQLFDALGPHEHLGAVLQPGVATLDLALDQVQTPRLLELLGRAHAALAPLGARLHLRTPTPLPAASFPFSSDRLKLALMHRLRRSHDSRDLLVGRPQDGGLA